LLLSRPQQMRVEPYLCDAVYEKRRPIFFNKGCQLPHYMNPSAPRCQTKYLKWICEQAQRNITDSSISTTGSAFVLPESDHQTSFIPPIPWLLSARNALVSKCGTIVTACGYVHTTANCMATGNSYAAKKFNDSCRLPSHVTALEADRLDGLCRPNTPYGTDIVYHKKVFVVAEVDDSHVYHLHLGKF
jgi:hypothetical protein